MCFPVIKRISSHHRSWTQINTVSLACPITKDYSSTDGREGISVSVTFLVSGLVIVPKPNQMRIWLRLRLITNRGGQQAICSAVLLIICEDRHTQSIPTADEKWICCYNIILQGNKDFPWDMGTARAAALLSFYLFILIRCTLFWEYLINKAHLFQVPTETTALKWLRFYIYVTSNFILLFPIW